MLLAWRRRGSLAGAVDLGAEPANIPPRPVFFPELAFILLHPSLFLSPSPLALPFESTCWTLETSNQSIHLQEQGILSPLLNLYVLIRSSLHGFFNVATLLLRV